VPHLSDKTISRRRTQPSAGAAENVVAYKLHLMGIVPWGRFTKSCLSRNLNAAEHMDRLQLATWRPNVVSRPSLFHNPILHLALVIQEEANRRSANQRVDLAFSVSYNLFR
jgi:hypothetical protein